MLSFDVETNSCGKRNEAGGGGMTSYCVLPMDALSRHKPNPSPLTLPLLPSEKTTMIVFLFLLCLLAHRHRKTIRGALSWWTTRGYKDGPSALDCPAENRQYLTCESCSSPSTRGTCTGSWWWLIWRAAMMARDAERGRVARWCRFSTLSEEMVHRTWR